MTEDEVVQIENLKKEIAAAKHDSIIINAWIAWDNIIYVSDPELDRKLNYQIDSLCALNLTKSSSKKENYFYSKSQVFALNNLGLIYFSDGDYEKSLACHQENLKKRVAIGDKKGLSNTFTNIGIIYYQQGDYATAIDYYTKSLKVDEENNNIQGVGISYNNIGLIYQEQGELEKALENYLKSSEIEVKLGNNEGLIKSYINIAANLQAQNKFNEAIEYFTLALALSEEIGDSWGIGASLNNLGTVYRKLKDYDKALAYFNSSLVQSKSDGDKRTITNALINIANIHLDKGELSLAFKNGNEAFKLANELNTLTEIKLSADVLWHINKKAGKHKEALEMFELYVEMRDSIESENNQKEVLKQEFKYQYEKKAAADSVVNAESQKVKDAEILASKEESKRLTIQSDKEKQQKIFLFIGLGLALVFGFFMYKRFQITNRQKQIIIKQKQESDEKNKIIAEQHHEITDSINYAEMIQQSVLPTIRIEDINKEAFVLMLPKDKVSGDFYWLENNEKHSYFVVADCTGHGIPGAFISMIGTILINEIYNSKKLIYPNDFLDELNRIIKLTLTNKDGITMKDGMDISFVMHDKETNEIYYAGANNPLWITSPNNTISCNDINIESNLSEEKIHLFEVKADKQPVGKYDDNAKSFTLNKIKLNKGDTFYIFTDGFADQFGGEKGKKFMYKPFKKLLLSINNQTSIQKRDALNQHFQSWKGSLEQIDDVCVIGVQIN